MATATINRPGHPLHGKTVTLGGSHNVFPPKRSPLAMQSVRDDNNLWHTVEKAWIEGNAK